MILDRTGFYPAGGGQPNDTGRLTVNGEIYNVVNLKKSEDDIIHVLDREAQFRIGDGARGAIEWEKRYAYMRYHTALHIIDGIVEKHYSPGKLTGGQIYQDRAHIDIDLPGLNHKMALEVIEKSNEAIKEGHKVIIKEISQEDALKIPDLSRTEPGRELIKRLPTVRVVEIEGFDMQADGGTHVSNTNEVGTIVLSDYGSQGAKRKRIEIVLK